MSVATDVNYYSSIVWNGLGTFTVQVPNTGPYYVSGQLTLPQLSLGSISPSQCVVTVKQNTSTSYTGTAGASGFGVQLNCTAGDSISVVTSSSAAVDNAFNAVKTTMQIVQGIGP